MGDNSIRNFVDGLPNGIENDTKINDPANSSVKGPHGLKLQGGHNKYLQGDKLEPLAIVGFSLKFPQEATTPDAFWKMLTEKRCAVTEWPKDRLNIDAFYHPDSSRPDTVEYVSSIQARMLRITILDTLSRRSFPQGIARLL